MKTQSPNYLENLSREQVKALTTEVKETIATEYFAPKHTFTAAELWNIQRQKKSFGRRNFA